MPPPQRPSGLPSSSHRRAGPSNHRDDRALPIAEPYDKHDPQPSRHRRNEGQWSWQDYMSWMQRSWGRSSWRNKTLRRVLQLRSADDANRSASWDDIPALWDAPGWIYALFHFPTGRLYVGQTQRKIWNRTREHWWSRGRCTDALHDALANDPNPFAYIMLPLERLPAPDSFPRAERAALIRRDALARERKWVGLLNSMWPRGFNAAYPGVPVSRKAKRRQYQLPSQDPTPTSQGNPPPSPDLANWLRRCHQADSSALAEARSWGKAQLCSTLDWMQLNVPDDERRTGHLSLECKLVELIKAKRKEAPQRQFLKFSYSNNGARLLDLRRVLREEAVFKLHPNPDVAAAIMVCDKFAPQWQAWLCNYARVAEELDLAAAQADNLEGCNCHSALRRREAEAFHEGHVVSNESDLLRWSYLQTLATKGKKYRLEGPPDSVLHDLRRALNQYTAWAAQSQPNDAVYHRKLGEWADAVEARCTANWQRGALNENLVPAGFPGLSQQMREAQKVLVFLHDDRAPHGLMFVCKRWYQKQMANYLADSSVFEDVTEPWSAVVERLAEINKRLEFPTGGGVVYNYGIWKPSKKKFRFIAGTHKSREAQSEGGEEQAEKKEPPRQPMYALNKALVALLKNVEGALREKDEERQQKEGIKAFWGIDSVESFVRMIRTHTPDILGGGLETADFTTMYTAFTFDTIINRTMLSAQEAWAFVKDNKTPIGIDTSVEPTLTTAGWSWDGLGYTMVDLKEMVTVAVQNSYTCNGGRVRRQIRGMPMGLPPAPQLANLACYPVERDHMQNLPKELRTTAISRYIDDIVHPTTMPLPTADQYGMEYKITGSGESVVCLGVRVYIMTHKDGQRAVHTCVHDREEEYPHHIVRYPLATTTAPTEQLGGVIMGRLEFARMACSHMADFKLSVANVFRNAIWRGYSRRLVQSVWSRFLFQRWHAVDIRVRELRTWFAKVWKFLLSGPNRSPPAPWATATPLREEHSGPVGDFLAVFGHPGPLLVSGIDNLLAEMTPPPSPKAREHPPATLFEEDDDIMLVDRSEYVRHGKQRAPNPIPAAPPTPPHREAPPPHRPREAPPPAVTIWQAPQSPRAEVCPNHAGGSGGQGSGGDAAKDPSLGEPGQVSSPPMAPQSHCAEVCPNHAGGSGGPGPGGDAAKDPSL